MYKAILLSTAAAVIGLGALTYSRHEEKNKRSTSAQTGSFTGYVTDSKCKRKVDPVCNKACFEVGEQPVLLLDGSGDLLRLNNAEQVKKYPGAHVEITGIRANDLLTVSTVTKK